MKREINKINKIRRMKKKGVSLLMENLSYLIVIVIIFTFFLVGIGRMSENVVVIEQSYSKQIALMIDKARFGTTIEFDISKLIDKAREKKYVGKIIDIDYENNLVKVYATIGKGYEVEYYSGNEIFYDIDYENKLLKLEVVG